MQELPVPRFYFMEVCLRWALNRGIIMNSRENLQYLRDLSPATQFCRVLLPSVSRSAVTSLITFHSVQRFFLSSYFKPFLLCWYKNLRQ